MSNYINKKRNRRRYRTRYRYNGVYKNRRTKPTSNRTAPIIVSVSVFFLIAVLVVTFTFGDSIYNWFENITINATRDEVSTEATQAQALEPTNPPKPQETQAPTKPKDNSGQDEKFMELLSASGYTVEGITSDQLVMVKSSGSSATIYCYEKDSKGKWKLSLGEYYGYVGANGISFNVTDGDACTPAGLYNIEYAFGTSENPGTTLEYKPITYMSYWVLDQYSQYYNQWVEYTDYAYTGVIKDWESAEWLWEYSVSYSYAINFGHNQDPATPGNGAGIFVQCSDGPTYGGVGMSSSDLSQMISWLDVDKSPQILIF